MTTLLSRRLYTLTGLAVFGVFISQTAPAQAELVVGLTTDNEITTFDSTTPGSATTPLSISGLGAGESLLGIDRRPANNLVYGVSITGNIYTINPTTGAATLISTLSTALSGVNFGVDFNPTVDRLRIVSDANQNLRVNVDTGVTLTDTPLAYKTDPPPDVNTGTDPNVVAAAYSNNRPTATTTILRDIDSNLDILATQAPPNAGTLNTVLSLGIDVSGIAGYDISGLTGIPYAAFILEGASFSGFYTLGPGGASLVDEVTTAAGEPLALRGIAASANAPEPSTLAIMGLASVLVFARRRFLTDRRTETVTNPG